MAYLDRPPCLDRPETVFYYSSRWQKYMIIQLLTERAFGIAGRIMGTRFLLPAPLTTGGRPFDLTELAMSLRRQSHFLRRTRKYSTKCVSTNVSMPACQATPDVILAFALYDHVLPAQVILAFSNVSMACLL